MSDEKHTPLPDDGGGPLSFDPPKQADPARADRGQGVAAPSVHHDRMEAGPGTPVPDAAVSGIGHLTLGEAALGRRPREADAGPSVESSAASHAEQAARQTANPGWGRAVTGGTGHRNVENMENAASRMPENGRPSRGWDDKPGFGPAPGGPSGGPPTSGGGSWAWQPAGMEPRKSWRKRHPILFWGGMLALLAVVFGIGRASTRESAGSGPRIAVIQIEGMILDAENTVAFMEKVRKDPSYKAAILRINSPGGAVGPSQELYAAAKRLSQAKPLVASLSSVAASGGYYAALGAGRIVAGPSSVTASIGVKMQVPNFAGLMRTVGVSETTLTTGKLKDAGSTWRDMQPDEEAYFRALIADMYEEFIDTVARERKLPPDKVRTVADGRAMTGRQALEAGLVDELGDFYAAVGKAKELAGIPPDTEAQLVRGPEKQTSFLNKVLESAMHTVMQRQLAAEQPVFMY